MQLLPALCDALGEKIDRPVLDCPPSTARLSPGGPTRLGVVSRLLRRPAPARLLVLHPVIPSGG